MTFFRPILLASASLVLISACGGKDTPETDNSGKAVEKREVAPAASPIAPPAPSAETEPSAEFASLPAPYNTADYARGRRTFRLCQSCHTLKAEGGNLVGPKLYGVFGRQVGSVEGFSYSKAVADADFIWSPDKLDEWLTSPRNFLPGNNMSFNGVRKPKDRLAVIAYIMVETNYSESDE